MKTIVFKIKIPDEYDIFDTKKGKCETCPLAVVVEDDDGFFNDPYCKISHKFRMKNGKVECPIEKISNK